MMIQKTISLFPVMDREAVRLLSAELRDVLSAETPVVLDGAAVEQIGQVGLQVLVSTFRTATAANIECVLAQPSAALCQAVELAGLGDSFGAGIKG